MRKLAENPERNLPLLQTQNRKSPEPEGEKKKKGRWVLQQNICGKRTSYHSLKVKIRIKLGVFWSES